MFDRLPLADAVPHGQFTVAIIMGGLYLFAAAGTASHKAGIFYIWEQATPEGKAIIACLGLFQSSRGPSWSRRRSRCAARAN